jgi:choline dehydrogenase-like flavoprotein
MKTSTPNVKKSIRDSAEGRDVFTAGRRHDDEDLPMTAALSNRRTAVLRAVVDRMVPEDGSPGGWDAGIGTFIEQMLDRELAASRGLIEAGLDALDLEAPTGFDSLPTTEQDALLTRLEMTESSPSWPVSPAWFVGRLAALCAQGYYGDSANGGNRDEVSWRTLGYRVLPHGVTWPADDPLITPTIRPDALQDRYDAIVIGAGAGGGVAAQVLAESGMSVLLVERGEALSTQDLPLDQLRSERSATGYPTRTGAGPDEPRVVEGPGGPDVVLTLDGRWSANAFGVGGGTRVYGAQAWRFAPDDFRMATKYGVPAGSALADWPIDYDDLEPWYDRCEWEYGVSGSSDTVRSAGARRRGYPMPPLPDTVGTAVLRRGADRLGLTTGAVPLLINSTPYNGRPACVRCGTCVGFACHAAAKNGTHNTAVPRALATGRCDLITSTQAERLATDTEGAVVGVAVVVTEQTTHRRITIATDRVVVAAGAIESARLLLNSAHEHEPAGIGNAHDLVGRHLQSHLYAGAIGFFSDVVQDSRGPGPSIATNDHRHDNPGVIGGGMIADDFVPTPLNTWDTLARLGVIPRWGVDAKRGMRALWSRMQMVFGPVQEVPTPEARVTVDREVRDRSGIPVARLSGDIHPEDRRGAALLAAKAADWLEASGAERVIRLAADDRPAGPSGGQHQAGTCRMGSSPEDSVTDRWARVWGHANLLVADGSVHVTNGGVNPVLTIMALAYRNSTRFAEDLPVAAAPPSPTVRVKG